VQYYCTVCNVVNTLLEQNVLCWWQSAQPVHLCTICYKICWVPVFVGILRRDRTLCCTTLTTVLQFCSLYNSFLANANSRSRLLYAIARPSVCRLSSVTLVRPTQAVQIFHNISTALGTLAIQWHPLKISRRSSQGTPPPGELNITGEAKYSDFGPIDGYISETVQDRR